MEATNSSSSNDVKALTDSSAEDSNSSSGVTTEEVYPQLNLELSIGLPVTRHQQPPQVSLINLNDSKPTIQPLPPSQHHHPQRQQLFTYQLSGTSHPPIAAETVCLCCNIGFQKSQICSCNAIEKRMLTADSLYRCYSPHM
uniref:Myb-related protein 330-like n=1 Tax=Rhizophora mucronata TaxID=61149 RepID=A0A2P2P611_RHIMU